MQVDSKNGIKIITWNDWRMMPMVCGELNHLVTEEDWIIEDITKKNGEFMIVLKRRSKHARIEIQKNKLIKLIEKNERKARIWEKAESEVLNIATDCDFFIDRGYLKADAFRAPENRNSLLKKTEVYTFDQPVRGTEALKFFLDNNYGLVGLRQGMRYVYANPDTLQPKHRIVLLGTLWFEGNSTYLCTPVLDLTFFRKRKRVRSEILNFSIEWKIFESQDHFLVYKKPKDSNPSQHQAG